MHDDLAIMGVVPMFEEVNALPGAQRQRAAGNGNAYRNLRQSRFDMGGHVVRAFHGVDNPGHRRIVRGRNKPCKECLQISLDIRVGVFLHQQGTGGVPHEKRQQALFRG